MKAGGDGIIGFRRGHQLWPALAFAWAASLAMTAPAEAQLFGDHPPPVPPAAVPDPGAAVSLAPPSGAASVPLPAPAMPGALAPPPSAAIPPVIALPPGAPAPGQGVLALAARYGKELPVINAGLVWRIFSDRPDDTGTFKLVREERGARSEE